MYACFDTTLYYQLSSTGYYVVTIRKIHTVAAEDSITELKLLVLQAQKVRTICVYVHNKLPIVANLVIPFCRLAIPTEHVVTSAMMNNEHRH